MFCIYLALGFFMGGLIVWMAGSLVEKRKKTAARNLRKKYQRLSERLSLAARICFMLCAVAFIFGFILLMGSQSTGIEM